MPVARTATAYWEVRDMIWTWERTRDGIGWPIALILGILVVILWVQGSLPKEWALVTLAVCAMRL